MEEGECDGIFPAWVSHSRPESHVLCQHRGCHFPLDRPARKDSRSCARSWEITSQKKVFAGTRIPPHRIDLEGGTSNPLIKSRTRSHHCELCSQFPQSLLNRVLTTDKQAAKNEPGHRCPGLFSTLPTTTVTVKARACGSERNLPLRPWSLARWRSPEGGLAVGRSTLRLRGQHRQT